jgi:hypothetical protein
MHFNASSFDPGAIAIPLRMENALPSFLTPSYYRQIITDGCSWAEQNKRDIFATAAITSIAHLAFGKRVGWTIFGAGMYRLWIQAEMEKIKQDQIKRNLQQQTENQRLATELAKISNIVQPMSNRFLEFKTLLEKYGISIEKFEADFNSLNAKTTNLQEGVQENSKLLSTFKSELQPTFNQINSNIEKTEKSLSELAQQHKDQTKILEKVKTNIGTLRQETRIITTESANHIISETKKLVQDPSYSLQEFDAEQSLKDFYAQSSLGSAMARGCFKPSFQAQSKIPS